MSDTTRGTGAVTRTLTLTDEELFCLDNVLRTSDQVQRRMLERVIAQLNAPTWRAAQVMGEYVAPSLAV